MNIWFAQATYFNVFLILFTLGILPDWTASCRIDVFFCFFFRGPGVTQFQQKGVSLIFIISYNIISIILTGYIHYTGWIIMKYIAH